MSDDGWMDYVGKAVAVLLGAVAGFCYGVLTMWVWWR